MESIEWAYPEGCMEFRIKTCHSKRATVFRSKLKEPPSEFITRVVRDCRRWSGRGVADYLFNDLKELVDGDIKGR